MSLSSRQSASQNRPLLLFFTLFALLLPLSLAHGQGGVDYTGTGGRHTIQGRVYFPSGRRADSPSLRVKLESMYGGGLYVFADANGSFTFKNLIAGSYTIVIESEEYELVREPVYIDDPGGSTIRGNRISANAPRTMTVPIYLMPKQSKDTQQRLGVLNAALASVPREAQDLYFKALEFVRAGEAQKAVDNLRAAISVYADFPLALNELGVQYLKLGQADKAAQALQTAVKLKPDDFTPRLNYGIALLGKKDFTEAEAQLRQALKLNEGAPTAHLYLGITLISLRRYDDAEQELERAINLGKEHVPTAYYYLGGIYWGKKDYKRAVEALETYLKLSPKASNADKVRQTIKELRAK